MSEEKKIKKEDGYEGQDDFTRRFDLSELQDAIPEIEQLDQEQRRTLSFSGSRNDTLSFEDETSDDEIESLLRDEAERDVKAPSGLEVDSSKPMSVKPQVKKQRKCNFCLIEQGKINLQLIYRDKDLIVFLDPKPLSPGQLLISTTKHTSSLDKLNASEVSHLFCVIQKFSNILKKAPEINAEAVSIFMSESVNETEDLRHLYITLIPREKNDGISLKFKQKISLKAKQISHLSHVISSHIKTNAA